MSSGARLEEYRLRITLLAPARVGAGAEGNLQRLLTGYVVTSVRFGRGGDLAEYSLKRVSIIPASTVKGLLRSLAEKIAGSLYQGYQGADPDSLAVEEVPRFLAAMHHQPTFGEEAERQRRGMVLVSPIHSHGEPPQLPEDYLSCAPRPPQGAADDWRYEAFASRYCPLCLLFGSNFQAGALRVRDAVPLGNEHTIITRAHVSIDRSTRARSEGKLYVEELLRAGTIFTSKIYLLWPLETLEETQNEKCRSLYLAAVGEARRLWNTLLTYLERSDVLLGGGKSAGHGAARIEIETISTAGRDNS